MQLRRYVLGGAQIPPDLSAASPLTFPTSIHRLDSAVSSNTMQFSFTLERQVAKKTNARVNYAGARGVQQLRSRDSNAPLPPGFVSRRRESECPAQHRIGRPRRRNSLEITLRGDIAPRVTGLAQYVFGRRWRIRGG